MLRVGIGIRRERGAKMYSKLKNGYMTEEKFILECVSRDIPISRPVFNVEPYDFVCETKNGLKSVQVKKSYVDRKGRKCVYVKSSYPRSEKVNRACQNVRVDYLAVYDDVDDVWYIIPREELKHVKSIFSVSKNGKYSSFINLFFE